MIGDHKPCSEVSQSCDHDIIRRLLGWGLTKPAMLCMSLSSRLPVPGHQKVRKNNCPKLPKRAQKAIDLHTFGVQVNTLVAPGSALEAARRGGHRGPGIWEGGWEAEVQETLWMVGQCSGWALDSTYGLSYWPGPH